MGKRTKLNSITVPTLTVGEKEIKKLVEALCGAEKVIVELFKEAGRKEVADWGIVNDGILEIKKVLANYRKAVEVK